MKKLLIIVLVVFGGLVGWAQSEHILAEVHIDQLTLSPWVGKIDMADAAIITLVRSLDPRNETVKKLMLGDYFPCSTSYMKEMLPLLALKDKAIRTRVQRLSKIGILDSIVVFNERTGHSCRYVKLSRFYYRAEERAQRIAEWAWRQAPPPQGHYGGP